MGAICGRIPLFLLRYFDYVFGSYGAPDCSAAAPPESENIDIPLHVQQNMNFQTVLKRHPIYIKCLYCVRRKAKCSLPGGANSCPRMASRLVVNITYQL